MPFFSVIIPVFNKALFIDETLKSALAQTFTDLEIIIVNDGSTDESEAIIKGFNDNRIHYFYQENAGVAVARNFGIDKALGEFICFLDADDYWYPNFLKTMYSYTQKLPEASVFACAIEVETKRNRFIPYYSIAKKSDFETVNFFDASQRECVLWTSAVAIRKTVFDKIGKFDEKIKISEDTELWIRIGLAYPVVFIWETLARYVYDESSISRNLKYFFEPYTFEKYALLEQQNPKLKKYLDLNRFSAVIKCKLSGDLETAKKLQQQIDLSSLNTKKTILIHLPNFILKLLVQIKNQAATYGLGNSVFR